MFKNEIKSVLRNKSNKLYIIVFIFLFLILNLSLNLNIIIDKYYDNKMQSELEEKIEISKAQDDNVQDLIISDDYDSSVSEDLEELIKEYNEYKKNSKRVDIKESYRMVKTSNGKELTEDQQEKLRNMKHVESLEKNVEKIFTMEGLSDFTVYYILVDRWKNCDEVQEYLDNLGITSYVDWGTSSEIVENYQKVNNLANIIRYILCGISLLIVFTCSKNMIQNEKENIKLLNVFGYKKYIIKNILFIQLFILIFIGACIGYFISQLITFIGIYWLIKMQINLFFINHIIINILIVILPVFVITRLFRI